MQRLGFRITRSRKSSMLGKTLAAIVDDEAVTVGPHARPATIEVNAKLPTGALGDPHV